MIYIDFMPCCQGSFKCKGCTFPQRFSLHVLPYRMRKRWKSWDDAHEVDSRTNELFFLFSDALAWVKKIAAFTPFRLFQLNWIELSLLLTILSSCFCARLLPLFFSINAHLLFLLPFVFPYSSCKQWMQFVAVEKSFSVYTLIYSTLYPCFFYS